MKGSAYLVQEAELIILRVFEKMNAVPVDMNLSTVFRC